MPVALSAGKDRTTVTAVVAVAVLALAAVVYQLWPSTAGRMSSQSFYTVDNGKTWFKDSLYKFPPFDHDGQTAVRALVFKSDHGEFVGMLHRFKPATQKLLQGVLADVTAGKKPQSELDMLLISDGVRGGTEAALPADQPKWTTFYALSPSSVKSPDRSPATFVSP